MQRYLEDDGLEVGVPEVIRDSVGPLLNCSSCGPMYRVRLIQFGADETARNRFMRWAR